MSNVSKYKPIRFPNALYKEIEKTIKREKKGDKNSKLNFSKWIKRAARNELMREKNISLEYVNKVSGITTQLAGVGRNLNQIALVANRTGAINLDEELLNEIKSLIGDYKPLLLDIKKQLKNSYEI